MEQFKKHNTPVGAGHAYDLNEVQENLSRVIKQLTDRTELNTRLITDVSLSVGYVNQVEHGLHREVLGYYVVKSDAFVMVFEQFEYTGDRTKFLPLLVTADATVDIVVFG
jgi:hypothetical protein